MAIGNGMHTRKADMISGKLFKTAGLLVAGLLAALSMPQPVGALTLDFSNVPNSELVFSPGGNFTFQPGEGGFDFIITGGSSGASPAVGLRGNITGNFNFGEPVDLGAGIRTASVTGSGTLAIVSPSGNLSGDLFWDQIASYGTGGVINLDRALNLTGITYAGENPALQELALSGSAVLAVSFQFPRPADLNLLRPQGGATSFSGSLAGMRADVPDPASSLILLGLACLCLFGFQRFRETNS
jgi:hypothetical protein